MGERKGQNFYYPPDFDPKKHKSLNGYHGTHALRERAKRIKEGILIIRFEMPYNIWCGGCEKHIGMGVRYNAEKTKVGMYYSTPIYKFRMKCHMCNNYFEIQTDPQNFTYVIVSGARRKEERWNAEDNEQIVTDERETVKKLVNDPMFKLEHDYKDKGNVARTKPGLNSITELQAGKKDDYLLNRLAREKFRNEKKRLQATAAMDKALLDKSSLAIKLVNEHEDDVRLSGLMKYKNLQTPEERLETKRIEIMNRSIFSNKTSSSALQRTPVAVAALVSPISKSIVKRRSQTRDTSCPSVVEAKEENASESPLRSSCIDSELSENVKSEMKSSVTEENQEVKSGLQSSINPHVMGVTIGKGLSALGSYTSSDSDNSVDGFS